MAENEQRLRLLDLFCGAGGAAMGYHRAGFTEIVGVDIKPMPRYPFTFVQADAIEYVAAHGREFDAIHASPPCQAFTPLKAMWNSREHPDLVAPTRIALRAAGRPYAIENVPGAPLENPLTLCGTMFGLRTEGGQAELRRHRLFECQPIPFVLLPPCHHNGAVIGVYGGHGRDRRRSVTVTGHAGGRSVRDGTQQFSTAARREAMGIDWMTGNELSQAIPPAYTEFIGRQLISFLSRTRLRASPCSTCDG